MGNSKLSDNAVSIATDRYFMEGEDWESLSNRVGSEVAFAENGERPKYSKEFAEMIYNMDFLPGGRILRNAGRIRGSLFNCYLLPMGDSIEEIGQFMKDSLILWSEGGGIGTNVSYLRPRGAIIKGKGGASSGPISFLEASDAVASTIESGGSRRAACLACMSVEHPDIMEFIDAKVVHGKLSNYNISVAVTDAFLDAVEADAYWELKFAQQSYGKIKAREVWNKIMDNMVKHAEPGLLNWTNFRSNNSYYYDPVIGSNPSLRAGTRVITDNGIFCIEELEGKSFKVPSITKDFSDAKCFLSGKNKPLYKITLQGGHVYYSTAEHKWPTVNKDRWNYSLDDFNKKRTDALLVGDYLPTTSKKTSLGFGTLGNYNDGFVIGWNIGDGWISNNDRPDQIGFIVSNKDQEFGVHDIIQNKLRSLGWSGNFRDINNNKETNVQNKNVREFFELFGVHKKENGIPKSIWTFASESFRKGFVDGLFSSDGCVSTGNNSRITLTSSHKKLIEDMSDLLGFYGITTNIKHSKKDKNCAIFPNGKLYDKTYHRYDLVIGRQSSIIHFNDVFNLTNKEKQNKIEEIINTVSLIQPGRSMKIVSIELTDLKEDVWDITVDDTTHCFELADVITGNCGEAILEPYGVCDLGSLVLPNFITGTVNTNWKKLETTVRLAVRFLDDVIDVNKYILKEVDIKAHNSRRIGLGIMGLAEYLFAKKLRYGSKKALYEIERLMRFIRDTVYDVLVDLAIEKGAFPKFDSAAYSKAHFVRSLPASIRMRIKKYGTRCVTGLAVAPTGCQVRDTMVYTDKGILYLDEIGNIDGDKWQDIDLKVQQENSEILENATKFYVNGKADTKRLFLKSGNVLESTFNHQYRVLVDNEYVWKRADEIKNGDYVVSVLDSYNKKTEPLLEQVISTHNNMVDINSIDKMNPKLAEFLGIYFGDGSNHGKGIRIHCNAKEEDNYLYVASLGEELFGIKPTFEDNGRNCMAVCFNSQLILKFLEVNGLLKQKSKYISIPTVIRKSSRNSIKSFIGGLWFADGSITGKTKYIDTASEKLSKELLVIIRALGNDARIQENVSGLGSKMFRVYIKSNNYKFRPLPEKRIREQLYLLGLNKCVVDEVVNVEDSSNLTFDIEVPKTITYVANSVVSHNTISLIPEVTSSIEPLFRKAYLRSDRVSDRIYVHPIYKKIIEEGNEIPDWFVDTDDIVPEDHFNTQVAVQSAIDGAVSKTINMPVGTTADEFSALTLEYIRDLKGTTVYVDGSREGQILNSVSIEEVKKHLKANTINNTADVETTKCANGKCEL